MNNQEFKVGRRVWSLLFGWGTVMQIDSEAGITYPMRVGFDGGEEGFTKYGFYDVAHKNPSLFHANQGKIEFDTDEPIEPIELDQPIWVRNFETDSWTPRHFKCHAKKVGVHCYWNGQSKHSCNAGSTHWQHFRTTDPALDEASQ